MTGIVALPGRKDILVAASTWQFEALRIVSPHFYIHAFTILINLTKAREHIYKPTIQYNIILSQSITVRDTMCQSHVSLLLSHLAPNLQE